MILSELIKKNYPVKGMPVLCPNGEVRRADWLEYKFTENQYFVWTFPLHPKTQQEVEDAQCWAAFQLELTGDPLMASKSLEDFKAGKYLTTEQLLAETKQNLSNSDLLHKLWTRAVGTPNYEKFLWRELEKRFLYGLKRG